MKRTKIQASELRLEDEVFVGANTTSKVTFILSSPRGTSMRVNGRKYKTVEYITADGWTHSLFADDHLEVLR